MSQFNFGTLRLVGKNEGFYYFRIKTFNFNDNIKIFCIFFTYINFSITLMHLFNFQSTNFKL